MGRAPRRFELAAAANTPLDGLLPRRRLTTPAVTMLIGMAEHEAKFMPASVRHKSEQPYRADQR